VNSELELVRLWLEAAVLEPDSRFCFNDTAELGWCGRERREVIPGSSLVIIECILHFWHHFNSTNSYTHAIVPDSGFTTTCCLLCISISPLLFKGRLVSSCALFSFDSGLSLSFQVQLYI